MTSSVALVWFRRDLRDFDHAALAAATNTHHRVHCAFVFDTEILDALEDRADARVTFIRDSVQQLDEALRARGGGLYVRHGSARQEIPRLAAQLGATTVYANRDYEPQAVARDREVASRLAALGIAYVACKDQVIFEQDEVLTAAGTAFTVFTPYRRAWQRKLSPEHAAAHAVPLASRALGSAPADIPSLSKLGFQRSRLAVSPGMSGAKQAWNRFRSRLESYAEERDQPALPATSGLSVHLRFGTVSIRELVRHAMRASGEGASTWLGELVWRDFFFAVLASRPDVVDHAFRREFDALEWEDDEEAWLAWREGRTGYPLVDAAMRELRAQGTMHNRLRMVTASFLVKDLGIDWRRGERYFASRLLDYDLAANNGNWQWCASTGCDAQPWFRIFNPVTQSRRFDPQGTYIRRWLPELASVPAKHVHAPWEMAPLEQEAAGFRIGRDYPAPIVSHMKARAAALERYGRLRPAGEGAG